MVKRVISIIFVLSLLGGVGAAQGGENSLVVEVTEAAGHPLKNACVTFVPREGEIIFRKANGRGRVKLKRLARGRYRVIVKVDGYEAQKKEITVGSGAEALAFLMQPRNY